MTPDDLRKLADEATPGPWIHKRNDGAELWRWVLGESFAIAAVPVDTEKEVSNARLIALAPDLARLCADLGEALAEIANERFGAMPDGSTPSAFAHAALAKLSELEAK